jgi:phosphonate transport system substrate-binding protein
MTTRFTWYSLLFLTLLSFSCTAGAPETDPDKTPRKIRGETITIAVFPEQNVFEQKKKYRPLMDYLSNALDINVRIKLLDSYGAIYDEIGGRKIDGAFFGSFNYVIAKARADIEPLARPVETDGRSVYRGIIFSRKDRGLGSDVKGWRGKRIALVHEVTTAGHIFPHWYLRKHGITDFERYFRKIIFTGSHDAAVLAVLKGQADLGAAKDLIYEKLLAQNPAMRSELVVIARSIELPSNSLCVSGGLEASLKDRLRKALLSLHETPDGKKALTAMNAVRFTETRDDEFSSLRVMVTGLGIDVKTFRFKDKP